ncbi:MAG: hypothetical protein FJ143_13715 [Deltaproteobacteria bacterium]|nr:hypothetical protein [Deltaproteobacteria bacterium]
MDFSAISGLKAAGFVGFERLRQLRETRLQSVPTLPGVYMVLVDPSNKPQFLAKSVGGHFKGQDPTVPIAELKTNWVEDAIVLNIGKAGGSRSSATLRSRINQYLQFGAGKAVGHRGGRYIWQLKGHDDLFLCWKPTIEEPREVERNLIKAFGEVYRKRPFANLQD